MPLNTAVSLSAPAAPPGVMDGKEGPDLEESIADDVKQHFRRRLRGKSREGPDRPRKLRSAAGTHRDRTQPLEKQVLDLHLTGMNYIEIAHILNRDEKSTDNALQRIRAKVRSWKK